jgi:FMN-dependent NADH-azoreductase
MLRVLHIDSSYSGSHSASRLLSQEFITTWKLRYPNDSIVYRDIVNQPVPYINETWVKAMNLLPDNYTLEQQEAMKESEIILAEFLGADRYVFGIPMYGFNVPAVFKAYIEHLIRPGRTYTIDDNGLRGLVGEGKKILVITSRGGDYSSNSPLAAFDFHEPYLRTIFGSFGITDIEFIYANNLELGDREKSIYTAKESIRQIIQRW